MRPFDQIEIACQKLARTPHTRRAQAITWKVWEDDFCSDPPCLQSIWCRMMRDDKGAWVLNTNVRFRSNDAYKAAFMNLFALVQLQVLIAARISALTGQEVKVGRYVHQADSYHIYGSYFNDFTDRFLKALTTRSFEERCYRYEDMKFLMDESISSIREKVSRMGRTEK
jgi:thymidylate synthase